uniref:Secreted protein n=1 Tax=Caenorhabditis japonica TaxID=281687 RepID=A0A8R1E2Q7_CAEJA
MCWLRQLYSPTVIVALFALLILVPTPSEANIRLCGTRLTTTLLAVCRNRLCGGMGPFKRELISSLDDKKNNDRLVEMPFF